MVAMEAEAMEDVGMAAARGKGGGESGGGVGGGDGVDGGCVVCVEGRSEAIRGDVWFVLLRAIREAR